MAEITQECARPSCTNRVSIDKAFGTVDLALVRRIESDEYLEYAVDLRGEICSQCSNDLADWWLK